MGIASGCVAGICGLTGWEGLGMYSGELWFGTRLVLEVFNAFRCSSTQNLIFVFVLCLSFDTATSLLFGVALFGASTYLGFENELSALLLHTAIGMVVRHDKHSTKWTILHIVLDAFLRTGISVLNRR
jgi:hypothetical protein